MVVVVVVVVAVVVLKGEANLKGFNNRYFIVREQWRAEKAFQRPTMKY